MPTFSIAVVATTSGGGEEYRSRVDLAEDGRTRRFVCSESYSTEESAALLGAHALRYVPSKIADLLAQAGFREEV